MPRVPLFASRLALVSVLAGMSALLLGCGDSGPNATGTSSSSAGGAPPTSTTSSSGSGGSASSSSGAGGAGGASASSSSGTGTTSTASATSSSTASGSSSAGSGSSSSTGGSAGGLGDPCTTSADCTMPPPNAGLFCDKPGCGAGLGTCALQPKNQLGLSQTAAPVCGCDHVTYWNAEYAAFHGVSIAAQGACAVGGGVACDTASPCPGTMKCNRLVPDPVQCSPSAPGTCWSMPVSCPAGGAAARACSNGSCQSVCDLIQSQNPWWSDATCP